MFTGLVEAVGTVRDVRETDGVIRLSVECPALVPDLVFGQSVAVAGVCLTVTAARGWIFDADMMPETVERTRFASLRRGARVNLERAMKLGGRLDGHLVQGHADGTAVLEKLSGSAKTKVAYFRASKHLRDAMRCVVTKGSVAVDGVSLTVIDADADAKSFSVGLIPATLENTTLGLLKPGDDVNVETDILGKYVERLLQFNSAKPGGIAVSNGAAGSGGLTLEEMYKLGY